MKTESMLSHPSGFIITAKEETGITLILRGASNMVYFLPSLGSSLRSYIRIHRKEN